MKRLFYYFILVLALIVMAAFAIANKQWIAEGVALSKEESREIVYGMPYAEWQALHQTEASPEKQAAFEANRPKDH